jgi:hypothetical protein
MILRVLKGRGMVSGLFEKKRDAIPPHPAPPQALNMYAWYKTSSDMQTEINSSNKINFNTSIRSCPAEECLIFKQVGSDGLKRCAL